ncbi:uncharacterized protein LOC113790765 [Dermatophagoides pteronyssinus]|uniref:Transmembrane protein 192 n=1 Tax=Dermatophagoides pteronyssinus TaxID=6956 RepID=A0ABQ8ITJ7_DERPT|nr:hypothetical protein DERP_009320 [Dermatophagoides pteronyssinus]
MDDDLQILTLPYNNDLYAIHRKTNNIKVIILLVLHAILVIINWLLSFVFPLEQHNLVNLVWHEEEETKINLLNSYNLAIYSQLILWLLSLLIKHYLKNLYYRRLRILGYNNHHDKVRKHVSLSSFFLHVANGLLLISTVIFNHSDHLEIFGMHLKPINAIEIIISAASIPILINIHVHIYHEIKFRRSRNPPDVFCVDDPSRRLTSDGLNQVAIRSSSFLEDLLENQADLIYNLKLQNSHLRELLYKATSNQNGDNQPEPTSSATTNRDGN